MGLGRRFLMVSGVLAAAAALASCDADQPIAYDKSADVAVVYGSQVHMLPRLDPARASSAATNAASSLQLQYYGGHVISNVKVVAVFWGPNVDSQIQSQIGGFYSSVTNSGYMDWLSEYDTNITAVGGQQGTNQHIGRGTFVGAYTISPAVTSGTIDDSAIQTEINTQINNGALPAPDADTIYMTYFPKGLTITQGGSSSCSAFCAYHGTFSRNGQSTYYGVMPDMGPGTGCDTGCGSDTVFNNTTSVSSHELIEAVTDGEVGLATTYGPPLAWYNQQQGEIGDICNGQQGTIGGYTVQKEYDNATGSCIVSKGTTANDFSVSVTPSSASVDQGSSVTYQVKTAVTGGAAQTISLAVSGLPTGVTGSFSPSSVSAGGTATLTLMASASANVGAKTFTVTGTATSGSHSANASVTVNSTGGGGGTGCINGTFSATDVPLSIPDNNSTGITSNLAVTGDGTVGSLALNLHITHTYRGDLVVTLYAPDGSSYVVSNRAGGSADNIALSNSAISAFNGKTAAGTWKMKVQDLAAIDTGTLDSWSLAIVGNCSGGGGGGGGGSGNWSASGSPNLATIDNGTACTTLTVSATGDASQAQVDFSGRHDWRSILKATLAHNGQTKTVFNTGTFPSGAGTFSMTNHAVTGFTGDASGDWQFCIIDTDAYGDTGTLNTWAVHN